MNLTCTKVKHFQQYALQSDGGWCTGFCLQLLYFIGARTPSGVKQTPVFVKGIIDEFCNLYFFPSQKSKKYDVDMEMHRHIAYDLQVNYSNNAGSGVPGSYVYEFNDPAYAMFMHLK